MRIQALAVDYDGTLARDGVVEEATTEALHRLRASGRRLICVTGRIVRDLCEAYPGYAVFDAIVGENGAVLFDPATGNTLALAAPPPPAFVATLRAAGVTPLEIGDVIVATWLPHDETVLHAIRELGLDLTMTFNKGAVMVLPPGVTKASGLAAQAERFQLSLHTIAGIGDAENDLAFLDACEVSAATANALPSVKERCDLVMRGDHGAGVREYVERIVADDLASVMKAQARHTIALGTAADGTPVGIPGSAGGVLLAGTSGGGKSTLVTGFVERAAALGYQVCVIDPEGDYETLPDAITAGDARSAPNAEHVVEIIASGKNAVVSLLGIPQDDRPAFGRGIFARIAELHTRIGRPAWLVIDEAHHVLPPPSEPRAFVDPGAATFLITTRPELVAPHAFARIEFVLAVGDDPDRTIAQACAILEVNAPAPGGVEHAHTGTAVVWRRDDPARVSAVTTIPPSSERRRHVRKYAEGELAPEKSFYFTGPDNKTNLRAHNLNTFIQLADGIDDETWQYHRARREYSRWMREAIGDQELAAVVEAIEGGDADARASRDGIIGAVRERYTAPA